MLKDNFWAYSNLFLGPTPEPYVMPRPRTAELLGEVTSRVLTGLQQISFSASSEPARGNAGRLFRLRHFLVGERNVTADHDHGASERAAALETTAVATPGERSLERVPFQELVREMLRRLGEDTGRTGLVKTPERVENSLRWLTRGYQTSLEQVIGDAVFDEDHHNMVIVKDIEMYSLCEHHLLPFFGKIHVAYIPNGRIIGLSKVPRLVEVFARRLQVQERLTEQVAQAVWDLLEPQGVGVICEARHLCMMMRGVEKQNSRAITSAVRGVFLEDLRTREEFLRLCAVNGIVA